FEFVCISKSLKSFEATVTDTSSKSTTTPRRLVPTHQTYWINHGRTRLLDRSNLIIIVADQSRFYNDSTSSLSKEGIRSIVWSYSDKHTFETERSCPRLQRMHI
uniref:NBS-LRR type resistance protein n=1 Tax=Cucumis melo TaxID=3656 RepID=A0A9I9E5F9_CUCME